MNNRAINKVEIQHQIDKFIYEYKDNGDFSKLIENFEKIIKEITSAQDTFILTVDSLKEEFIIWSQKRHIVIEDMEDTISIILESYYRKKLHYVENLTTSFLYNRKFDQLVEYQLQDILVFPILDNDGKVAYIIWLAHPKGSHGNFSSIDFENMKNFIHSFRGIAISKEELNSAKPLEDTKRIHEEPLNILVVDDDTIILKFLSAVLHKQGFHVELGHSGIEAISVYKALENIEIIFMDEIMHGGMCGHEAIEKIRSIEDHNKKSHIPIVALTSDTSKDTRQLLLKAGCDIVLYKPIDSKHIIDVITQLSTK